jgi:hypothetical protein
MSSKNNDFTLYVVMLMCGPVFQMETFMMYDNVSQSFLYPAQQLLVLIAIQRTQ